MNNLPNRISYLISKYLNDELTEIEKLELDGWVQQSEDHQLFFRQFTEEDALSETLSGYESSKSFVYSKIKEAIAFSGPTKSKALLVWWLNPRKLTAVAASIIVTAGLLWWWSIDKKEKKVTETVAVQTSIDRQPASEGAVLKLDDGKEIILDNTQDGAIAKQGSTQITKQGGQLSYASNNPDKTVLYNTLSTPNGRIYKLLLPDGSLAWLDAASSIRFPTAFVDGQRSVTITGEVYFEVKKDAQSPFRVTIDQRATIEVLGTHFNVNAYDNEELLRTTLLEGSVKVSSMMNGEWSMLRPGQQAQMKPASIKVVSDVNIKKVMGWKDGYFSLDDLTLPELMREVERWYDVEVVYEKGVPAKSFFGKVDRNISLLEFMDGLKAWGVRSRLEGRKLIITGAQ